MQFLLYCLCGGIGVSTDYLIYYSALTFGLWYQAANILGYLSGTLISFFLNRKITFGIHDKIGRRLLSFLGVAAIGFFVSALMLWVMVDIMSISTEISKLVSLTSKLITLPDYFLQYLTENNADAKIAKLLTLPVVVIIQFSLNRRLTFSENSQHQIKSI